MNSASALRFLASLWLFSILCFAQPNNTPLTLDDCTRLALGVPSSVTVALLDREAAEQGRRQARASFLPQSNASLGYAYNSPIQGDISFIAANGVREFTALAAIIQEIDTSGRLRADYRRALANRDAAGISAELARRDLRRAVAAAYYRLLLARHLEEAIRQSLTESEAFEHRVTLLTQSGEAARADVVKASAQLAFLKQALNAAQLTAELANQDLASYWTRDVSTPLNIVDLFTQTITTPDAETPVAGQYLKRLEFNLLDAQIRGFRAEAQREKAALFPQIQLGFQYGLDAPRPSTAFRGYTAYGQLTVPIFDWFRSLSASRQFQARAQQVEQTREIDQRRFSSEYQSALRRVQRLFQQLDLTKTQVSLAEEDLKLSRIRYEGGEGAAVDVVVAQNQLAQARANYFTAIADYLNARRDLEVASGQ